MSAIVQLQISEPESEPKSTVSFTEIFEQSFPEVKMEVEEQIFQIPLIEQFHQLFPIGQFLSAAPYIKPSELYQEFIQMCKPPFAQPDVIADFTPFTQEELNQIP